MGWVSPLLSPPAWAGCPLCWHPRDTGAKLSVGCAAPLPGREKIQGRMGREGMMGALCSPQSSARRNSAFLGKGSARETPLQK